MVVGKDCDGYWLRRFDSPNGEYEILTSLLLFLIKEEEKELQCEGLKSLRETGKSQGET